MKSLKIKYIICISLFVLVYSFSLYDYITIKNSFLSLTLILLYFLFFNINFVRYFQPNSWLLNPVVLCSILTFALGYGGTNFLFFLNISVIEDLGLIPEITFYMLKHLALVILGAVAMWLGYWFFYSIKLKNSFRFLQFKKKYFNASNHLRKFSIPALLIISVLSRLIQINLGLYGFSTTSYDHLIDSANYTQFLTLGSSLGKAALLIVGLKYYKENSTKNLILLILILLTEIFFGVLSGFKFQIFIPLIILVISYYLIHNQLNKLLLSLSVISLFFAYSIVEPFRNVILSDSTLELKNSLDIINTISEGQSNKNGLSSINAFVGLSILTRSNLTWIGSFGIEFKDKELTDPDQPKFFENLILAPFHAFIPRVLWTNKPLSNNGLWYTNVVIGKSDYTSTAMGPITYLYFAGKEFIILLFFFLLGFVQSLLFFIIEPTKSVASSFLFLAILMTITVINSDFNSIVISIFRDIPLLLILNKVLFKRFF